MSSPLYEKVKNCYGQSIFVNPVDVIGRSIIERGVYDRKGITIMRDLLLEIDSPTMLDIGANIGNHTVALAGLCSRLISFEPQSFVYSILQKNVLENKLNNVIVVNKGLSDRAGKLELYVSLDGNNGSTTFNSSLKATQSQQEFAEVVIGDEFLQEAKISAIDVIKLDVEGFEVETLSGLRSAIHSCRPLIFMEWDKQEVKEKAQDKNLFNDLFSNYGCFRIAKTSDRKYWSSKKFGLLHRLWAKCFDSWVLLPANLEETYSNLVLIPKEKNSQFSKAKCFSLLKAERELAER